MKSKFFKRTDPLILQVGIKTLVNRQKVEVNAHMQRQEFDRLHSCKKVRVFISSISQVYKHSQEYRQVNFCKVHLTFFFFLRFK